jgi:tRNA(adenine34) deaminase
MSVYTPEYWMKQAIAEAELALKKSEVPIGAVIVMNNQIVGRGHNVRETAFDATGHAEMMAIRDANRTLDAWRLSECDLYVTLEPCPMCAGAILQSRIKNLYFGAHDPKAGCTGTLMNLLDDARFNHRSNVYSGILADECALMLRDFFKKLRS